MGSAGLDAPHSKVPGQFEPKKPWSEEVVTPDGYAYLKWFFPQKGGRINMHAHDHEHWSDISRGTFFVYGAGEGRDPNGEGITVVAPDFVRFHTGVPHSMVALTDEAFCVHHYPFRPEVKAALKGVQEELKSDRLQILGGA